MRRVILRQLFTLHGLLATVAVALLISLAFRACFAHPYAAFINKYSEVNRLDPQLVAAVIHRESHFRPHVVSNAGAIGLMQVRESMGREWARTHARKFARKDLFNPETNIEAGTWLLAHAMAYWDNRRDPLPFVLAEYIAGRSAVIRWSKKEQSGADFWKTIPDPTVKKYIRDILQEYRGGV